MKRIYYLSFILSITFFSISCSRKQEATISENEYIEITAEQFAAEGMQLSEIETKSFEDIVKCSGTIVPKPNGMATVTAPIAGVITKVNCVNGEFIQKNQTILEISGSEVIDIQRDYAEALALYKRSKSEYQRLKSLFAEKIISEKEFIVTESDFRSAEAKYNGLKLKLVAAGFSLQAVEKGEFSAFYTLKSPISGYISGLKANLGTYINQQSVGIEIADPSQFQLELAIFATDITKLKKGQAVRFHSAGSATELLAELTSVGVVVDADSKSIHCYATPKASNVTKPIANNVVSAEIIAQSEPVFAVPTEAIIKAESSNFVLVLHKKVGTNLLFNKVMVEVGRQQNSYIELIGTKLNGQIISKGVYNIVL